MTEQWLPVVDWEDRYEVSDLGHVRSVDRVTRTSTGYTRHDRGRMLTNQIYAAGQGYPKVSLSRDGKYTLAYVHRLVLLAFVGPAPTGMECRHLNGIRTDARLSNLQWGTKQENMEDIRRHGHRMGPAPKDRCGSGHLFTPENTGMSSRGVRVCRTCRRAWQREYRAKNGRTDR